MCGWVWWVGVRVCVNRPEPPPPPPPPPHLIAFMCVLGVGWGVEGGAEGWAGRWRHMCRARAQGAWLCRLLHTTGRAGASAERAPVQPSSGSNWRRCLLLAVRGRGAPVAGLTGAQSWGTALHSSGTQEQTTKQLVRQPTCRSPCDTWHKPSALSSSVPAAAPASASAACREKQVFKGEQLALHERRCDACCPARRAGPEGTLTLHPKPSPGGGEPAGGRPNARCTRQRRHDLPFKHRPGRFHLQRCLALAT